MIVCSRILGHDVLTDGSLARNVLLLSLIIDESGAPDRSSLWNIYYHLYLDEDDVRLISDQSSKLLKVSTTLKEWNASSYGVRLPLCDQDSLDDLRACWAAYVKAAESQSSGTYVSDFKANLKHSLDAATRRLGDGVGSEEVITAMRSASPVALQSKDEVTKPFRHFWEKGVTDSTQPTIPNPLIASSISENLLLHYGTDPILGFHLATVYVSLAEASPLASKLGHEKYKAVAAAKSQFREWTSAFRKMSEEGNITVRFAAADALAFCHNLQHYSSTGGSSAGWYKKQLDSRVLKFDSTTGIPKAFDAIDTSNLADHLGVLNVLISAVPLLASKPWATLTTETLLRDPGSVEKEALNRLLCGHSQTVSAILGVTPVEYWTNATAISKVDEILIGLLTQSKSETSQIQSRIFWKHAAQFAGLEAHVPLFMPPQKLAGVLFEIFLKMFEHENPMALLTAGMANSKAILHMGYPHFHRGSFVALLKYVKAKMATTDFVETCKTLDGMITSDQRLAFGSNTAQDLGAQLHMHKLWSPPWLSSRVQRIYSLGNFNAWESIPEVVSVTLVVPRQKIKDLYNVSPMAKVAAPTFIGSLTSSPGSPNQWHNMFGDVHLVFGNIVTSGSPGDDDFSVAIDEDKAGWSGTAPLVASFYVPTAALQAEPKTGLIGLDVQTTTQSIAVYRRALGEEMRVFQARLEDEKHVFVTRFMPGQSKHPAYCDAAGGAAAESERPKVGDTPSTKAILSADANTQGQITIITGHLDVTTDTGKRLLAEKVPIELRQTSPFVIDIAFGDNLLALPVHFPVAVDAKLARTRIARKSAYVEVIVPFADPASSPILADFVFPSTLVSMPSRPPLPVTLNTPHLSLDRLPIIDITEKSSLRWLTTLASFQFSVREKRLRDYEANKSDGLSSISARVNFKESLFTMFMLASGLQGGQTGLFAIDHPERGGIHMLIFVSAIRLDPAAGSVVLDAAVLPFTLDLVTSKEMEPFLLLTRTLEICSTKVNDDELVLWKKALPALAERARTWSHGEKCEYAKTGSIPLSLEPGEQPLCSCGKGKLPKDFLSLPEWDRAAKHATRVAISPTFAVPFVEDVVDMKAWEQGGRRLETPGEKCAACGAKEGNSAQGGQLRRCKRCMRVRYCSAECQKKDWKKHRGECEESS